MDQKLIQLYMPKGKYDRANRITFALYAPWNPNDYL